MYMNQDTGNVLFPVFFKLHQLNMLIVGGGYVGLEKLTAVLRSSPKANVTLVAKEILQEEIRTLAKAHPNVTLIERAFKKKDLEERDLVILATDSQKLHQKVKKQAEKKHILTNVADTPDLCDFYLCSIVKKGDLKIGISSNGKSPTLTKRIKETLHDALPEEIDEMLDRLKEIRDQLKGDFEYKVQKLDEVTKDFMVQEEETESDTTPIYKKKVKRKGFKSKSLFKAK